jgi:hypothetical protein
LQNSCEWNRWRGEFVLERPSSETQSISVAVERWSVEHRAFAVETIFKINKSVVVTQLIIRRLFNTYRNECLYLQYFFLWEYLRSKVYEWETNSNGGLETKHQGQSGSNFSNHAATSDAELPKTLAGMC